MNALLAPLLALSGSLLALPVSLGQEPVAPVAPKARGAVLTGRILFDGQRPESRALPATPEQTNGCCPGDKAVNVIDPRLVIDDKNGLSNVLVTVEVPDAKLEVPTTPFVLDQRACVFEPHCLIVPAGAKVIFKNSDSVSHNVHVFAARNEGSNNTIAAGGQIETSFAKPEKVTIGCDYHPWMSSVLMVVDTPYCALTKADGTFQVSGLPPGSYKVKLWHETLGRGEAQATVKEDGTVAPLEMKMALAKKKP